jgi:hypothetical protein
LPICDDFALDISTGVSDWYVKGPAAGAVFTQATLSPPDPVSPWSTLPGCSWAVPGLLRSQGDYTYRLQFKLCSGFREPILYFQLLADDYANVFLNGHQLPPVQTGGTNFTTPIIFSANSHFKAGNNELTVVVHNSLQNRRETPTGLALNGWMGVANGRCAGEPYPLLVCPEVCYYLQHETFYANPFGGGFVYWHPRFDSGCNGAELGDTTGKGRAEQFGAALAGTITPGTSIEYRVFTRNLHGTLIGWSPWMPTGLAGTTGPDAAITALQIKIVSGPVNCRIRYQVATRPRIVKYPVVNGVTWGPWVDGPNEAGSTTGFPDWYHPIVAVRIEIV